MTDFTDQVKAEIYRNALNEVNKIRSSKGREPINDLPKGKLGTATSCPIQRALECYAVDDLMVEWTPDGLEFTYTPEPIGEFINAFDDHEYPELEE